MARQRDRVRKTLNVRDVHDVHVVPRDGTHEITFSAAGHKIHIHASRWLISYLARQLWDVHKFEVGEVERLRKALRGE